MKKKLILFTIIICSLLVVFFVLVFLFKYTKQNEENIKTTPSSSTDVIFEDTSGLERVHNFLTNKEYIKYDIPKDHNIENYYVYSPIKIQETILSGCASNGFLKYERFDQYLDKNIKCNSDEVGFLITIPGGTYNAYIPKDKKVTHCSITNPIVCWNEDIDKDEVLEYYHKHNECPEGFGYSAAGTAGPTAYCTVDQWYCHHTTCDYIERDGVNIRTCNLEERIWCGYNPGGPRVALGNPCDFFRGMGVLPADGSCG